MLVIDKSAVLLKVSEPNTGKSGEALIAFAAWLQRALPRGKGAVLRKLGEFLLPGDHRRARRFVTRHGATMLLDRTALDVFATMYRNGRAWDYHDFQTCMDLTRPGGVFYDIGANVGYESIEMCKLRGPETEVVAFEPHDRLAKLIAAAGALNGFDALRVVNCLVGDADDADHIFYIAPSTIHASAVEDSGRQIAREARIPMYRIDTLVEQKVLSAPTAVKMDVEGSEHLVFEGACQTFRTHRPHIFLEYNLQDDPELRIRRQINDLLADTGCYDVFGHTKNSAPGVLDSRLVRMDDGSWNHVHSIVLHNREAALASTDHFTPDI